MNKEINILEIPRKTQFISPFVNKYPKVLCPGFHLLHWAMGCVFKPRCSMCWLSGTENRYFNILKAKYKLKTLPDMVFYNNEEDRDKELFHWLLKTKEPSVLNANELTDSLNTPHGIALAKKLMNLFEGEDHKVLFVTKAANDGILELAKYPTSNAILSFSITPNEMFEVGADHYWERIATAKVLGRYFKHIRFRIDPLIPIPGWLGAYAKMIHAITVEDKFNFKPERITVGRMRFFQNALNQVTDERIRQYLYHKRRPEDNRWVLPDQTFIEMVKTIMSMFPKGTNFALCKEPLRIWQAVGLNPKTSKCNCVM